MNKILVVLCVIALLSACSNEERQKRIDKQKAYASERCKTHLGLQSTKMTSTKGGIYLYMCKDHTVEW